MKDATRGRQEGTVGSKHAPEPLLPNFGAGVMRHHYMDMNMLSTFNSAERTVDDFIRIGQVSYLVMYPKLLTGTAQKFLRLVDVFNCV